MEDQHCHMTEEKEEEDEEETVQAKNNVGKLKNKKKIKPGIIYLSSVPTRMTIKLVKEKLEEFGEINRTYFEHSEAEKKMGKKFVSLCEGWVEFKDRKYAKSVAMYLNNTKVGGKKKLPWSNCTWNIKYLSKFKFGDIQAEKDLKKALHESRMRAEIDQVKKEANFYASNYEQSQRLHKIKKKEEEKGQVFEGRKSNYNGIQQKRTAQEIQKRKNASKLYSFEDSSCEHIKHRRLTKEEASRQFVMKNIFGSS